MNTSLKHFICCLGLLLICVIAQGQEEYVLQFSPIHYEDGKAEVAIELSFDKAGQLGTSNLVFDYNFEALSNPRLIGHNLPSPFYKTPSLKSINGSIVTLNIELLVAGKGLDIGTAPISLATIQFDYEQVGLFPDLQWRNSKQPFTEIFLGDNSSQLIKGKSLNLQPPAAPAKGPVGELAIVSEPNSSQTYIEFESQRSGIYALELVDENGNLHHSQSYDFRCGKNSVQLNTGFFLAGKYTVRILFDEEQRMAEVVFVK